MITHAGLLALFSLLVSVVLAAIGRDAPGEQMRLGLRYFAAFVGAGLALGWLMYPLPF